ncbi:MAG TPA: hypothetical protein PLO37_15140 [Candidatus Hydrogenedentes bacterium]|nr:hypothetical protein [Candidatus Hydrogenedentota bacterium]HPG68182.1 hypothetical protein [Candidatus Hydrogenedentota bacterium]
MAIGIPSLEPDPDFGFPFPRPVAQHMPLYVKCLTPRYLLLCDETFFSPDDPRPYSEALVDLETRSVVPVRGLRNSGKGGILLPPTSDYFVALGSQGLQVVSPASGQILRRVRYPDEGRFEQCVVEADWAAGRLSLEGTWHSKSAVPSQRCLDVNLSKGTVSVILPKGGVPPTASASTPQRDSVMRAWARVQERSHGGTTWVVTDRHTMTVLDKFAAALPKDTEPAFGKIFVSPDDRYIFATHYDSQRGVTMVSVYSAETAEVINSFSCEGGILGVLFR